MKNYTSIDRKLEAMNKEAVEMLEAAKRASKRQLDAISTGERRTRWINGRKCYDFKSKDGIFTYDTVKKAWIG